MSKPQINKWSAVFAGLFLIVLVVIPLIQDDIGMARNPQNYMTLGWQEATQYLRSQLTLEQDAEYYKAYKENEMSDIPCVLTWWDNGYWIVRDSHMPVISNPGGDGRILTAKLLMSKNSDDAVKQLKELNIKYIVIDSQTAIEKFYAVVQYAGLNLDRYYIKSLDGMAIQRTREYYGTLLAKLYVLDNETKLYWGNHLEFEQDPIKNYQIDGIRLVFKSSNEVLMWNGTAGHSLPEVKVFEVQ